MPPAGRGQLLMKLADLIERDLEQLSQIESLDNGKPMMLSRGDIGAAAACFRYYAGWSDKIVGQTNDVDPYRFSYTRHEPVGVCGQIIPCISLCIVLANIREFPLLDVLLEDRSGYRLR